MGDQALIALFLVLNVQGVARADAMPSYASQFPYPHSVTGYGEINGSYFFSARGVIADSPRIAVERLERTYGKEGTFAHASPNGNHGVFWQLRGMKKPTGKEKKKVRDAMNRVGGAMVLKMEERTGTQPLGAVLWMFDLLCSLDIITDETLCMEIRPLDIAMIMDAAFPRPQLHAVSMARKSDGTHFNWSIWPEVKFESLFGMGDIKSRKSNCRLAKHPLPDQSDCQIVGRFISNASSGRIEISHSRLPLDAAEKFVDVELGANGWATEALFEPDAQGELSRLAPSLAPLGQSMAVPGFRFLRNAASGATLMLKCDAHPDGGSQILYVEMEAGG